MKIEPDRISTQVQDLTLDRTRTADEGFGDILAGKVRQSGSDATGAAGQPPVSTSALGVAAMLQTDAAGGVGESSDSERAVMENMDTLLSEWENYAGELAAEDSEATLRRAYGVLENIESGVKKLKDQWPDLGQDNPALGSLVNELEVMAVTEKIKFNRGDYL